MVRFLQLKTNVWNYAKVFQTQLDVKSLESTETLVALEVQTENATFIQITSLLEMEKVDNIVGYFLIVKQVYKISKL